MKILIFTETYLPTINGVVNSIESFRKELVKRGHKVYIIAPHSKTESFKERDYVFRLLSLPFLGQPSHPVAWPYAHQVKAIVDEIKPDIIHVQGVGVCGWLGLKIAHKEKIPCMFTYHTLLEGYAHYAGLFSFIIKPLMRWWSKYLSNKYDLVITPSPNIARVLKKYGVKSDIVALPTGVEISSFRPQQKTEYRKNLEFDPDKLYLLSVGRLAREKNIQQLLTDFGRLHTRSENAHLIIAGDGPDRMAYEGIVESHGLSRAVTFLGSVEHKDLIPYFVASDIFCFPSLTDTQGIVLVEAMASGIPSVVYDTLGPGDLIKNSENGLKAKVGTDQFFTFLSELVQNNELREKLGVGALREARKYTIEKTTDQLEQIYQVLTK